MTPRKTPGLVARLALGGVFFLIPRAWSATCDTIINVKQDGTGNFATIQSAVNSVPSPVTNFYCIFVDSNVYSEQVTIQGKDTATNNKRIWIMSDPNMISTATTITPPMGSTAAFHVMNDSVSIVGFNIVSTNAIPYGVFAAAKEIMISSVNVDSGGNIYTAGIALSSWNYLSYSSITVQNAHGLYLDGWRNEVYFSTALADSGGKYALYLAGASTNTIAASYIANNSGIGAYLGVGSSSNTISFSTITSNAGGYHAFDISGASSNTIVASTILNQTGFGVWLHAGAYNTTIDQSVITSNGVGKDALEIFGSSSNVISRSYISAPNGYGIRISPYSSFNAISNSTITSNSTYVALDINGAGVTSNTVTHSFISNPAGYGLMVGFGAAFNEISFCTMTSNAASYAALWIESATSNIVTQSYIANPMGWATDIRFSKDNTIAGSYVQGSGAVAIRNSTGTALNSDTLVASNSGGSGLWLTGGSANLFMSSTTVMGGPAGMGINLDQGNSGDIVLTSVAVSNSPIGLNISTQNGANIQFSTLTFTGPLPPGTTAINFTGGMFIFTSSYTAFEHSNIAVNVNASMLSPGSLISMLHSEGSRMGQSFENDPFGYVQWGDIETPTNVMFDDISTFSITASAYAATPAFADLKTGQAGVNVAKNGAYGSWRNGDVWTTRAAMPTGRGWLATAVVGGKIYALGGYNGTAVLAHNEEYDSAANTWTTKPMMPNARQTLAVGVAEGRIYAIGGHNGTGNSYALNEEYDPVTGIWSTKAAMPTVRYVSAAASVGGKVYVLGGWNGFSTTNVNEEYDPATDVWSTKAVMPTARYGAPAAIVGDKIYVVGGNNGSYRTVNEQYDPVENNWTTKAPMPSARVDLAAGVVGGKILAVGGNNGSDLARNEEYDPAANVWTTRAAMITARWGPAAGVVRGKICVVGGNNPGYNQNEEYDPGVAQLFTGLTPNALYTFKAKARNSSGAETAESPDISTYTLAAASGALAGTPLVSYIDASSMTVNWSSGTMAGGFNGPGAMYLVVASTRPDFNPIKGSSLTANTFATIANLDIPSVAYYFRVKAQNNDGIWNEFLNLGSIVPPTLVETPTNIVFDDISTFSITASAYAATPAFADLKTGQAGVNVAIGPGYAYSNWRSGDMWTTRTAMPTSRYGHAAVALAGKVYAIGGYDNASGFYTKNEEYDPVSDAWTTRAAMPTARDALGLAVMAGKLYAMGGCSVFPCSTPGNQTNRNEEFDPLSNSWATRAAMPTVRQQLTAAAAGGKVYTVGGTAYTGGTFYAWNEEYDPAANAWITRQAMPTARDTLAAAAVSGKIYVVGGWNNSSYLTQNEEYDTIANVWVTRASMPTARHVLTATVVGGKLYAVGGGIQRVQSYPE